MRILKITLFLFTLFLFFQVVATFFMDHHAIQYILHVNKRQYQVEEHYQKGLYQLEIRDEKKNAFHFQFPYNYNKQKEIVKDLKILKQDNLVCIYPLLLKNKKSSLRCRDQDGEFSYQVLKEKYPDTFQQTLLSFHLEEEEPLSKKENDLTYYPNSIFENDVFLVWCYSGAYYVSKDLTKKLVLFSKDQYENSHSIKVGNYYLVANSDENHEFYEFILIDLKDASRKTWKLKEAISFDSYFLGVVDDFAYLFDRDSMTEYKVDPKRRKIEVVGNKEKNGVFYDGSWMEKNIYDFAVEELSFTNKINNKKVLEKYKNTFIYEGKDIYYLVDGNKLYAVYQNFLEDPILLLTAKELKEIMVVDDILYFLVQDTLYSYHMTDGLKKVLTRREIGFNYKNIYTVYKK